MSAVPTSSVAQHVATSLDLPERKVAAVLDLLADKATVPFIARYRKEATGNLDEVQIRSIAESQSAWAELEKRRTTIIKTIKDLGHLTDDLKQRLLACNSKASLEDIYLPFRPKRQTRATAARDRGLEPLAMLIIQQSLNSTPSRDAQRFVSQDNDVPDANAALAGARDIVAEQVAERASIRALVRRTVAQFGTIASKKARGQDANERTAYEQYYEHTESIARVPSHRYLAMARGERDGAQRDGTVRGRAAERPRRRVPVVVHCPIRRGRE